MERQKTENTEDRISKIKNVEKKVNEERMGQGQKSTEAMTKQFPKLMEKLNLQIQETW